MEMTLYSQKNPAYANKKLGASKLTMQGYGCFVASIATLYQMSVDKLLEVQGAFTSEGYLNSSVLARFCGGAALPAVKNDGKAQMPKGWCIAVTDHYKAAGVPTHFFPYNTDTGQRIDPLDFPALPEKNTYNIVEFRPFSNIKLDTSTPVPVPVFPDVPVGSPREADIKLCKERGIMKGGDDGLFRPTAVMTREEQAAVAARLIRMVEAQLSALKNGSNS